MWFAGIKKNEDQEIMREHSSHRNRLLATKSYINIQSPKEIVHLKKKCRPRALKAEESNAIQAKNNILLKKMMEINERSPRFSSFAESSSLKSLNLNSRAKDFNKVAVENQQILQRLTGIKSSYSFKKFDEQYKYKQYLKQKVSENSRRISSSVFPPSFDSARTPLSRHVSSAGKMSRPMTAAANRNKSNYLEL